MEDLIMRCPNCKLGQRVIKKGRRKNRRGTVQIYKCLRCMKYFTYDPGFVKMRYKKEIITKAIDLWIKGNSLSKIRDHLEQFDGVKVYESTILRWTRKYVNQIKKYMDELQLNNKENSTWSADETTIVLKGQLQWLWQIIEKHSRFLLATNISADRGEREAQKLFEKALTVSKPPKEVVTDGLNSYAGAHRKVFDKNTKHRVPVGFLGKRLNNQMIERMNCTIKDRLKPMHGLYSEKTAQNFIDAFQIWYNFMKPHKSLFNQTPAEVAGIDITLDKNKWLSLIEKSA
jgi:putative transposase